MALAVLRDRRPHLVLEDADQIAAFEQDLLAEFVLARASAGVKDATVQADVSAVVALRAWSGRPLWEVSPQDLDRYFGRHRRDAAAGTKVRQAAGLAVFFEFLEIRHKAAIHQATGFVVESPLDELNRPRGGGATRLRLPPSANEAATLFAGWRDDIDAARKYAPIARNYTALRLASLIGPRVSELCLLQVGDIRWETGLFGKILLRGKGSRSSGKKERLVPLINGARELLEWWVSGPRWLFDDRGADVGAPLFPSERRFGDGANRPVTDDALRAGLAEAVAAHLPAQVGKLTPHVLRHFAASQLYRSGMGVAAIQEILGHEWLNTTMIYVHVEQSHIEDAWVRAGERAAARYAGGTL